MPALATRTRILDTAERLFAEHGFAGASLRRVVSEARVNLAAVHYHFGSKPELMRAVLERRIHPMNAERLRLLEAAEAPAGRRTPCLEAVIEALLAPPMRMSRDPESGGRHFMQLIGRTFAEADPAINLMFFSMFEEVFRRFMPAFARACPSLPQSTLIWRCHFMIGGMAHTLCKKDAVKHFAHGACDVEDTDGILHELIAFVAAGLRAPPPPPRLASVKRKPKPRRTPRGKAPRPHPSSSKAPDSRATSTGRKA